MLQIIRLCNHPRSFIAQPDLRRVIQHYVVSIPPTSVRTTRFASSFITRTAKDWNSLSASGFSPIYDVAFNVQGVIAPVFTPMHEDGRINLEPVPEYAKFLVKNGIRSILVGGTTGEFVSLSVEEKKSVLGAWMNEAKSLKFDVMVHVGGAPLPYVIEMAKYAEEIKVNSILTLPELYFKPKTPEELVSYIESVSKAAPSMPLVYYHNPVMSGVDVNWPAFFKLAKSRIPNFVGMKADLLVANQVASQLSDGHKVFICNHVLAPSVLMGHDSSIATVATMFPKLVLDTVEAAKAGDATQARTLQTKLNELVDTLLVIGNFPPGRFVPTMKAAMAYVTGIKVGPPRAPLTALDDHRKSRIHEKMKEFGYCAGRSGN